MSIQETTVGTGIRFASIDAVRLLGITAVVAAHVWTQPLSHELFYTWHVPLFFVLTGYLWKPGRTVLAETRKRASTLLVPYATWLVIIGTAFLWGAFSWATAGQLLLGGAHVGRPFSAFWFVTALFFGAVVMRLLERTPWSVQWGVAGVALLVAYLAPQEVAAVPLSAGVGVASLVFILAGSALRRHRDRIVRPATTGIVLIALSAVVIATGVSAPLDLKPADFGTPLLSPLVAVAISTGLVLVAERLVPLFGRTADRAIILLASCGLLVVLTHPVVLWVLGTPPTGSRLAFMLALGIPFAVGLLLRFTPLSWLTTGVRRIRWWTRRVAQVSRPD
ncbi:acyltransferase family protein [Compostimonas suwonensis]|uniref:Fucose 4-O-acetylase-like acetyltransferase n=1 Tax=Compostimonas suwonensis TaxID=1048394 RepID=A0A2M9BUX1_9MICO|nr:acyltransferase family protein [Compostimonas suwonensis]PJJ61751.1 fucose 4-O-acetylase-like acetyltransferase [Compostimonas suwonensis]